MAESHPQGLRRLHVQCKRTECRLALLSLLRGGLLLSDTFWASSCSNGEIQGAVRDTALGRTAAGLHLCSEVPRVALFHPGTNLSPRHDSSLSLWWVRCAASKNSLA